MRTVHAGGEPGRPIPCRQAFRPGRDRCGDRYRRAGRITPTSRMRSSERLASPCMRLIRASKSICPGQQAFAVGPGVAEACQPAHLQCEHGTHVSGIVAGRPVSVEVVGDIAGVAPAAGIYAVKTGANLQERQGRDAAFLRRSDGDRCTESHRDGCQGSEHRPRELQRRHGGGLSGELRQERPESRCRAAVMRRAVNRLQEDGHHLRRLLWEQRQEQWHRPARLPRTPVAVGALDAEGR